MQSIGAMCCPRRAPMQCRNEETSKKTNKNCTALLGDQCGAPDAVWQLTIAVHNGSIMFEKSYFMDEHLSCGSSADEVLSRSTVFLLAGQGVASEKKKSRIL
ncbi:hypothetical protein VPH35_028776 [Triticum aestivum]